jgi:hypothetical protein
MAWIQWRNHLQHLQSNNRLIRPLGKRITSTHQRWSTLVNPVDNTLHQDSDDQWSSCTPLTDQSLRVTCSSRHFSYDVTTFHPVEGPPLPTALLYGFIHITNSFYPGMTLISRPLWTALGRPLVRMIYMSALMAPISKLLLMDLMHGFSLHLQELSYGMGQVPLVATAL